MGQARSSVELIEVFSSRLSVLSRIQLGLHLPGPCPVSPTVAAWQRYVIVPGLFQGPGAEIAYVSRCPLSEAIRHLGNETQPAWHGVYGDPLMLRQRGSYCIPTGTWP